MDLKQSKFLITTFKMLQNSEYEDIVGWNSMGTSLVINNRARFIEEVLPVEFSHKNLSSFIRQLNLYGFKKNRDSADV